MCCEGRLVFVTVKIKVNLVSICPLMREYYYWSVVSVASQESSFKKKTCLNIAAQTQHSTKKARIAK